MANLLPPDACGGCAHERRDDGRVKVEKKKEDQDRTYVCVSLAILFCLHSDISMHGNYCKSYFVIVPRTSGKPPLIALRMCGSRNTI